MKIRDIIVLGDQNDLIANAVSAKLRERGGGFEARAADKIEVTETAILLFSPSSIRALSASLRCRCNCVLLPGCAAAPLPETVSAQSIVSYGMSCRDTVTFSSLSEANCILSLQREIVTVSGDLLDRQEFPVVFPAHFEPMIALAVLSALLLSDFPPELMR